MNRGVELKTLPIVFALVLTAGTAQAGYNPKWVKVEPSVRGVVKGSGQTVKLTATFEDKTGIYDTVAFELATLTDSKPANPSGTASKDFDITANVPAYYTGKASIAGVTATCQVVVVTISCTVTPQAILANGTATAKAIAFLWPNGRTVEYTILETDTHGYEINGNGLIKPKQGEQVTAGTITIRAADYEFQEAHADATLELVDPDSITVEITPDPVNVPFGDYAYANARVSPPEIAYLVNYDTADHTIATVPSTATSILKVTGLKADSTTLRATVDGVEKAYVDVNVIKVELAPRSVIVSCGGNATATATITPQSAAGQVEFAFDNVILATVSPATAATSPQALTLTGNTLGLTGITKLWARLKDGSLGIKVADTDVTVVKLESNTLKHAADHPTTPDTRTTVGVCEEVTITVKPPINADSWQVTGGGTVSPATAGNFTKFTAGDVGSTSVITATFPGGTTATLTLTVIAPDSAAWKKLDATVTAGYPAGNAGCYMNLSKLTIGTKTVNFEGIVIQEVSGPPSSIAGWYSNNPPFTTNAPSAGPPPVDAGNLWHRADGATGLGNGPWLNINQDCTANAVDKAGIPLPGYPPNYVDGGFTSGTFTWVIPMHYKRASNIAGAGIKFATVNQVFTINQDGTLTVTKDDSSICTVTRTP